MRYEKIEDFIFRQYRPALILLLFGASFASLLYFHCNYHIFKLYHLNFLMQSLMLNLTPE